MFPLSVQCAWERVQIDPHIVMVLAHFLKVMVGSRTAEKICTKGVLENGWFSTLGDCERHLMKCNQKAVKIDVV